MAKTNRTPKESKFFESLGQAEPMITPEEALWRLISDGVGKAGQAFAAWAKPLAEEALVLIPAGARDASRYLRRFTQLALSRPARRSVYLLVSFGLIGAASFAVVSGAKTLSAYAQDIASPTILLNKKDTGTTILDRNGQVLFQVYGASNRTVVQLNSLPKTLIHATLAAEDPNFYQHDGFSWKATARAVYVDLTSHSREQGGSTITQQLVKNALLTPDKSLTRKYQEILLSMEMERRYNKDQIMQMYLNEIYYGQGSYGIESAAQTYFHKPASQLTLPESALLAGMPLGPSRFDPTIYPDLSLERRNFIIDRMLQLGYITSDEAATAKATPIKVYARQIEIRAPHFVFYVLDQLRQTYGDDVVENGGITVYTTLDLNKQTAAEQIVANQINRLAPHHTTNGGLISLNPNNGDIMTMVGSYDYNNPDFGKVNVTLSDLQPGSSFKPFAYVTAFAKGYNGATTVMDGPVSFPNGDGTYYVPKDYDGRWRGEVTLRRALANSLNIPAIKVLQFAGIHDTIQTAHNLGITTLDNESRFGLSLVLGGGEVRPIDMAAAYGAFATGGFKVEPRAILKVLDRNGNNVTKTKPAPKQSVLDPRLAYMITNILSDNQARTEEFGANSPLRLSRPAAAKTGTTNDFRDNWTVGYTPDAVTAVWVGNNDHSAMINVDGITGAAPIWHDYMEMALAGTPIHDFTAPAGLVTAKVCGRDGGLINPWDSGYTEYFLPQFVQSKHCGTEPPAPPAAGQPATPADQGNQGNGNGGGNQGPPEPVPSPEPPVQPKHNRF